MTKEYDFSVFDIREHNFGFANMTENQIDEKKKVWDDFQKAKQEAAASQTPIETPTASTTPAPKPVFKPKIKPPSPPAAPKE